MENLYYVGKSRHYHTNVDMWSDEEVVHVAENGVTLCGRRVKSEKKGWFKGNGTPKAADMAANPTKSSNRFGEGCCRSCAKILAKREKEVS
jgi:hypothetical protein